MPGVGLIPPLTSPPSNAFGLFQYVAGRIPGYDPSEYLREINSAYIHVWEEISKLKNYYFTNVKVVTVTTAGATFDLLTNVNGTGGLSAPVSARLYQISRIRMMPPGGQLWQTCNIFSATDSNYLTLAANPTASPAQTGPYYMTLTGRGLITLGVPAAVGTQIEVLYSFWPLALTYQFNGTVSSTGLVVTGTNTTFTQMVQPDFQSNLPLVSGQEEIQAELVANNSQVYRVTSIASDTTLSTQTAVAPALVAGSAYVLATVPEIPREHIRVIGSVALAKMFSVDGDDSRVAEWTGISASNMQMMKDSLLERQSNNPPTKQRFPYGVGRRNRAFLR